ncbi:hypothetical protein ACEUCK_20470, partial [Aeromonas veronii]
ATGAGSVAATAEPSQLSPPVIGYHDVPSGDSFEQACEQLGLSQQEQQALDQLQQQQSQAD